MGTGGTNHWRHMGRRIALWIVVGILMLLAAAYLGIGAYAANSVTLVEEDPEIPASAPPGIAYEEVSFPARGEDLELAGWYLPKEGSSKAVVLVHGRDANRRTAMAGTFVALAEALNRAGYSVLLFDLRGHGQSGGEKRYSFGVKERRDVLGAVDWLLQQGIPPGSIAVLGTSMGGASATGATAEEPAIGALILDSTLSDLKPLIQAKFVDESGLPLWFVPGVLLMNRVLYGYDLTRVKPVQELALVSPRPVLILHCTEDEMVPLEQGEALAAAMPEAETWYVGDCKHAEIHAAYPAEYQERVVGFLDQTLK